MSVYERIKQIKYLGHQENEYFSTLKISILFAENGNINCHILQRV
jgi:hypothetical protein